jgi:valyl-tRNA synthetase
MAREPFADVYVTGTVLDKHGQRMSKTKGNGIDPLEVFDKYGVDATRLTLASVGSTDTRWSERQVESYRNFANKIWNAARFCLLNADGAELVNDPFAGERAGLPLHDRWIVSRLNKTARDVNAQLEQYDFHGAVQTLYHFFWDGFCDWYIELSKATVTAEADSPERTIARARLISVLEQSLRLLHPFMPYLTEELWQRLPVQHSQLLHPSYSGVEPTIMLASYPQCDDALLDERAEAEMGAVIELISRVRNIRSEMNIKPGQQIDLLIETKDGSLLAVEVKNQVKRLTRSTEILEKMRADWPKATAYAVLTGGSSVGIPLEGLIDFDHERARLSREKEKLEKEVTKLEAQLGNADFVERAPAEKVEDLRLRKAEITLRNRALNENLEAVS